MCIKTAYFFNFLVALSLATPTIESHHEYSPLIFHADRSTRIVGGTQAAENSHPHMVALSVGLVLPFHMCGASLISTRTVLTAAHCLSPLTQGFRGPLDPTLRGTAGTNRVDRGGAGGVTFAFDRYVVHEDYIHEIIKNDIGLLFTRWNVPLSNTVQVIPLNFDYIGADIPVRVAGFGVTQPFTVGSPVLMELELETVDGEVCQREVDRVTKELGLGGFVPPVDPQLEICSFYSETTGTCQGDSGSALTRRDTGHQVGLVSWGVSCATQSPDMQVRLSAYQAWLERHLV